MGPHRIFEQSEPVMPPTAKFLQHAGMVRRRRIVLFVMAGHSRPSFDNDGARYRRAYRYVRGSLAIWREVISRCGGLIRVQTLPVQKKRPNAQASTRSEFGPCIAISA
jgi:hypothetical protein